MSVSQAEAIAKTVPGLKHVVLWRGLIDLSRDIPNSDVDLLALRNRLLVRKELHPALQYLLLEAMREVHSAPGPFNRFGEFPAEQPNDLPLSATAEAFYRSGPLFWQRYTSFWISSLLSRIVFFVIPVLAALIPVVGFTLSFYRWLRIRRAGRLYRALGKLKSARYSEPRNPITEPDEIVEIKMISKMIVRRARAHPSYIGPDRAQRFVEQRGSPAGSLPSADLAGLSGVTHPHGRPLAGKPLPGARAATPAGRINEAARARRAILRAPSARLSAPCARSAYKPFCAPCSPRRERALRERRRERRGLRRLNWRERGRSPRDRGERLRRR